MASHKKHAQPTTFALPGKSQMVKIVATVAAVGLLATGGIVSHNLYATAEKSPAKQVTAYSVTDSIEASRGNAREALSGDTSYVTVKINGKTRVVPGMHFTDVKSVLDAGDITLDTEDTVSPSLDTKVNENTVIKIERAGASVEVSDTDIAFNTVKKETSSLPKGQEKVETEGANGVMETTNLVTKSGGKVMSSNMISSFVKKAPTDKVILVGTGSSSTPSAAAASIGTTVPAGEMQQWAHDYLLSSGYSEADFTATVYIISHESGWNVAATNPSSGAYGLLRTALRLHPGRLHLLARPPLLLSFSFSDRRGSAHIVRNLSCLICLFYISYGKMQAIHGVTVVYARNSFIAFIAALLAILRVSERPDATGSKKPSCSFSTVHRQPSTLF